MAANGAPLSLKAESRATDTAAFFDKRAKVSGAIIFFWVKFHTYHVDCQLELKELFDVVIHATAPHDCHHNGFEIVIQDHNVFFGRN